MPHATTTAWHGRAPTVASLRDRLVATVGALLAPGEPVALIDFPNHDNAGDSAIWAGERRLLASLGHPVAHATDMRAYDPALIRRRVPHGTLLLHGGGNLGDLWDTFQAFRERVVADFLDRRIVQLPQTVHFTRPDAIRRARNVFDRHPDLTLLVRDRPSLDFTTEHFAARSLLCPDAAFALDAGTPGSPVVDVLWLSRTDAERAVVPPADLPAGVRVADWSLDSALERRRLHLTKAVSRAIPRAGHLGGALAEVALAAYDRGASRRVGAALRLLSTGRIVITDRLHGHILCMLRGIPHVLLDNSYGKLRAFHETWTCGSPLVARAADPAEALAMALMRLDQDQPRRPVGPWATAASSASR